MPHPVPWTNATTPSTFGYCASSSGPKALAINRAAVAEQFTDVRMPI